MQLVVNTDKGFYRHYLRVRRWYGAGEEPAKRGGLCKPCQTILWGTILAVLVAPLIGVGWLVAKAFDRVTGGGGNAITRHVGGWRMAGGSTWAEDSGTQGVLKAPVLNGAFLGLLTLVLVALAVALTGVLGLGVWHVSDIAAWIGDFCTWIGGASLTVGWFVFAALAYVGLALNEIAGAALRACAWASENRSWLAGWAVTILTPVAIAAFLSWALVWFCMNTRLGAALFADPVRNIRRSRKLAAEMRKERREEAMKWLCACGHKTGDWRDWCNSCGEQRDYGPPGPGKRLSRWFRGRAVAGRMRVMGGGGIAWAFVKGVAKGACPIVEFLSPEEMREKAKAAAEEDRARRAEAVQRILGRER